MIPDEHSSDALQSDTDTSSKEQLPLKKPAKVGRHAKKRSEDDDGVGELYTHTFKGGIGEEDDGR